MTSVIRQSGPVGVAIGAVVATVFCLVAWAVGGVRADGAIAWNFMWLPLGLGLATATWALSRRNDDKVVEHLVACVIGATVGYTTVTQIVIAAFDDPMAGRRGGPEIIVGYLVLTLIPGRVIVGVAAGFRAISRRSRRTPTS